MAHSKMIRVLFLSLAGCGLAISLSGCSSSPSMSSLGSMFGGGGKAAATDEATPAEQLYRDADALLGRASYEKAAAKFEEVDRQHPYSPLARKAIVMAAWAHFKDGKFTAAVAAAKRYTTLHPGTKEAALAQHIIASSYFDQIKGPQNDQTDTRKALKELEVLVRRYPTSRYAKKARNRILIVKDVLAAKEMTVGRYYLKNRNYLAAINRFKTVVSQYQTTKHVEEALYRLTESYLALGITNEAQNAASVLGHNYPESRWYKNAYALLQSGGLSPRSYSGSWLTKTWKSIKTSMNPFR